MKSDAIQLSHKHFVKFKSLATNGLYFYTHTSHVQ